MEKTLDKYIRTCLIIGVLEGVIATIALLLIPTDPKNSWLFVYSKTRVLSIGFVIILTFFLVGGLSIEGRKNVLRKLFVRTANRFKQYGWLLHIFVLFWFVCGIWFIFEKRVSLSTTIYPELLLLNIESWLRFLPIAIFGFLLILQFSGIFVLTGILLETKVRPSSMQPISTFLKRIGSIYGAVILLTLILAFNKREISSEKGLLTYYSFFLLLSISLLAFYRSFLSANREESLFFGLIGLGFVYFAIDEKFEIHEQMGDWAEKTWQLRELEFSHYDDFIIAFYLLIGLIFLFKFHKYLFKFNQNWRYMIGAIIFAVLTILIDLRIPWLINFTNIVFDKNYIEDATKIISEYFLLLSLIETYKGVEQQTAPQTQAQVT
jgi:hypothetical protein